jgi:hypothetical protein
MPDKEVGRNDQASTASREAQTRRGRELAEEVPLQVEERKTQIASGAASGLGGAVAGAATGVIVGGPIGAAIGAIAGAAGGWWVGHASVVAGDWTDHDEAYYREHHSSFEGPEDRTFEVSRPAYHLGHIASRNPDYRGRGFDDVEPELRLGWTDELRDVHGGWDSVRDRVRVGYERPRGSTAQRSASVSAGIEPLHADPATGAANRTHDRLAERRGPDGAAKEKVEVNERMSTSEERRA